MIVTYYQPDSVAEKTYKIPQLMRIKLADPKNGDLEKRMNDLNLVHDGIPAA